MRKEPFDLILGTDWWTDCDDAVAVRLAIEADKRGYINLKGVILNAVCPDSANSLSAFMLNYGKSIPIGADLNATDFYGTPVYQKKLSELGLPSDYRDNFLCMDGVRLYRKLLSESKKGAEIVEIGFPQVITELLFSSPDAYSPLTGMELVKEKVTKIWMMAGRWDVEKGTEHNFANNSRSRRAAAEFCEHCPVPVTFLGFEVGATVITGDKLKSGLLHTLMSFHGSPHGRSSWDPMTMLLAVIGDEDEAGYSVVRGKASVNPETGENSFIPSDNGLHRYVVKKYPDSEYAEAVNALIAEHGSEK